MAWDLAVLWDPSVRPVALGTAALGAVSGMLGTFAVVRRQSLVGDAVAHAALPGVALAYLLGGTKEIVLVLGAAFTGWLATLVVAGVIRRSRVSFDAALGGALAVFFGLGLVLMTDLQRRYPGPEGVKVHKYLFGQDAALMRTEDLWPLLGLGIPMVMLVVLFWKEFQILSFDPDFAASLGMPVFRIDMALTALIVLAVVLGLQSVGVVLMSALLVAPAAAARQWAHRLGVVATLAAFFGALAGFLGTLLAHWLSGPRAAVPTGPTIVLTATMITLISLAIAPGRGLVWQLFRRTKLEAPPA